MSKNVIYHGRSRDTIPRIKTPINCVVTDPPFGIDVQMNSASSVYQKAINMKIENDFDVHQAIGIFYEEMVHIIPKLADQADIYIFTAWNVLDWWLPAVRELNFLHYGQGPNMAAPDVYMDYTRPHGIDLKMMLIWDKGYPGKGDLVANWGCGYEPILYLKKGRRPNPYRRSGIIHVPASTDLESRIAETEEYLELLKAIRDGLVQPGELETGIIAMDKLPPGQNIHPTEKPVPLLERLIDMSTSPGELVVDPFSGSGSTSVAAQKLGRNSLAFEIDNEPPRSFVDKARARLEQVGLFAEV
jgi:adenine-specific DNA-methyltransferase